MDVTANRTKEGSPLAQISATRSSAKQAASLGEDQDKWDKAQKRLYQVHDPFIAGTEHQGGDGQQEKQLGARVQLDAFLASCYYGV